MFNQRNERRKLLEPYANPYFTGKKASIFLCFLYKRILVWGYFLKKQSMFCFESHFPRQLRLSLEVSFLVVSFTRFHFAKSLPFFPACLLTLGLDLVEISILWKAFSCLEFSVWYWQFSNSVISCCMSWNSATTFYMSMFGEDTLLRGSTCYLLNSVIGFSPSNCREITIQLTGLEFKNRSFHLYLTCRDNNITLNSQKFASP